MHDSKSNLNSNQSILILCAGLGMGNASRVAAITEEINILAKNQKQNVTINIGSWGAGFQFLNDFKHTRSHEYQLFQLESYENPKNLITNIKTYFKNSIYIYDIIKITQPKIVIIDSDYHCLSYIFNKNFIFSISQAHDILKRAKINNYRPKSIKENFTFILREKLDFVIQYIVSHKIFVPCFEISQINSKKIIPSPLIVRNDFLKPLSKTMNKNSIGILLSGSKSDKEKFIKLQKTNTLTLISPDLKHTKISQAEHLDELEFLITQGGLSSISEGIAREKFLVVFPIPNHPEQIINALEVERLNLGLYGKNNELENIENLKDKIRNLNKTEISTKINLKGANFIAQHILKKINDHV